MSITPNNHISPFIAKKASIPQTSKFLNKVGDNAQTTDTREVGAASKFKDVLNDTRVTVQFENLEKNTFTPFNRPGHSNNAFNVKA